MNTPETILRRETDNEYARAIVAIASESFAAYVMEASNRWASQSSCDRSH